MATALRQAAAEATREYDAAMAPSGIRVTMLRPLSIIEHEPGISISELGRRLDLDRSTAARNLRVLERAGHLVVKPGRDDRSRGVHLTERGRAALDAALLLWRDAQSAMGRRLGSHRETLLALLDMAHSPDPNAREGTVQPPTPAEG